MCISPKRLRWWQKHIKVDMLGAKKWSRAKLKNVWRLNEADKRSERVHKRENTEA